MEKLQKLVESSIFQRSIIAVIFINAAILGLLTIPVLSPQQHHLLAMIDQACLVVFCIELALKLVINRVNFFKSGWNVFDLLVVGVALVPNAGGLSVLRSMRALRLMRLATAWPSMRRVVSGMFRSIPGAASVAGVLSILYYVAAVMGVTFFRESNPKYFGDLGEAFYTLFQTMTLEGWWIIADAVIEKNPNAWVFFVVFIILTTFTTLNLLFGIIVGAMGEAKEEDAREMMKAQGVDVEEESSEVRLVRIENEMTTIAALVAQLELKLQAR